MSFQHERECPNNISNVGSFIDHAEYYRNDFPFAWIEKWKWIFEEFK